MPELNKIVKNHVHRLYTIISKKSKKENSPETLNDDDVIQFPDNLIIHLFTFKDL